VRGCTAALSRITGEASGADIGDTLALESFAASAARDENGRWPPINGAEVVARLVRGDKEAWDAFVERFSPVIYAAVSRTLRGRPQGEAEIRDLTQDVFLRLCKDDYRLLSRYEPKRSTLVTWLTVVATSTTLDALRRKRGQTVALDDMPEEAAAVDPVLPAPRLRIPKGLLSPRQALVLQLVFERDMDVAEVATLLAVNPQTVRSTQHKALVKLRKYFGEEG